MRIRVDKWLVVLAVVGLSTLSWWMPIEPGPVSKLVTVPEKRHIPDFYLTDFDLTTMNAAGRPRYYLQAAGMEHFADDDTSRLTMPNLTVYRQEAAPWQVRSNQAQVAAAGQTVVLQDDVRIRRMTTERRDALQISTSLLRVVPAEQYAETDEAVTIETDLGITRAIGMHADLKRQQFQLLAQVRGDYARR